MLNKLMKPEIESRCDDYNWETGNALKTASVNKAL